MLYYIWESKHPDLLRALEHKGIEVVKWGIRNKNQGPDFEDCQIKIDNTLWAGYVEMHVSSSDWFAHKHHLDPRYNSVILHIVYRHDLKPTQTLSFPYIELQSLLTPGLVSIYQELMNNASWIPCEDSIHRVEPFTIQGAIQKALLQRLSEKTKVIQKILDSSSHNWEETFFRILCRNFGFHRNNDAFEQLSQTISYKLIKLHQDSLLKIEAILFGQSGLLETSEGLEEYTKLLKQEYNHIQRKYNLKPVGALQWKFHRLRPANFPTIRLAQLAVLLHKSHFLFSKVLAAESTKELFHLFQSDVSWYWRTHYQFDHQSTKRKKTLGKTAIDLLVINTIVPIVFLYGKLYQNQKYQDKAIGFLEDTTAENNTIIRKWKDIGIQVDHAMSSQGLLTLKNSFCSKLQCLRCPIGNELLKQVGHEK